MVRGARNPRLEKKIYSPIYWISALVILVVLTLFVYFTFFNSPLLQPATTLVDPLTVTSQCPDARMTDAREELERSCTALFDYLEDIILYLSAFKPLSNHGESSQ